MPSVNMPAPRVPPLDPRTGQWTREWFLFLSGLGGAISDGNKGDVTVSDGGATVSINAGAVGLAELGGDITAAGEALLDDADAAAQRATLAISADNTPFSAVTVGNWPAEPTDVGYALNQLAARMVVLESHREMIPVGGLFLSVVATDPETLLGYGVWTAIAAGRVLVGLDSGDTDFDTLRETQGAKLVAAAGTNSAPTLSGATAAEAQAPVTVTAVGAVNVSPAVHTHAVGTLAASAPTFTGSATSVVQPSYVCYIWERTA